MSRLSRILLLALALAAASPALAAEADKLARLDADLKALAAFDYGKDAGPLSRVEDLVFAAVKDPARREAVEQGLLRTLGGDATVAAKSFICRQLRTIGTARSVRVLEPMLADKELGHMARYALGRMEDPAAEEALRRALAKTSGPLQAGIASSLGDRASAKAVPDLARLLGSSDALVADAAASALGRTGGPAAVKALEAARTGAAARLRPAIDDAMLACAGRYLTAGRKEDAAKIYEVYNSPKMPKHIQIGALGGLVAAKGDGAVDLLVAAIRNPDAEIRTSAIGFARSATGPAVTKALVGLLPTLVPEA
ncbi:MAG: HEAT repeat domain-containing protein, partial [Planctomycetes bacterium]|nr:HEAT repeat domain-containing protein [Planctomycetota bacterium]